MTEHSPEIPRPVDPKIEFLKFVYQHPADPADPASLSSIATQAYTQLLTRVNGNYDACFGTLYFAEAEMYTAQKTNALTPPRAESMKTVLTSVHTLLDKDAFQDLVDILGDVEENLPVDQLRWRALTISRVLHTQGSKTTLYALADKPKEVDLPDTPEDLARRMELSIAASTPHSPLIFHPTPGENPLTDAAQKVAKKFVASYLEKTARNYPLLIEALQKMESPFPEEFQPILETIRGYFMTEIAADFYRGTVGDIPQDMTVGQLIRVVSTAEKKLQEAGIKTDLAAEAMKYRQRLQAETVDLNSETQMLLDRMIKRQKEQRSGHRTTVQTLLNATKRIILSPKTLGTAGGLLLLASAYSYYNPTTSISIHTDRKGKPTAAAALPEASTIPSPATSPGPPLRTPQAPKLPTLPKSENQPQKSPPLQPSKSPEKSQTQLFAAIEKLNDLAKQHLPVEIRMPGYSNHTNDHGGDRGFAATAHWVNPDEDGNLPTDELKKYYALYQLNDSIIIGYADNVEHVVHDPLVTGNPLAKYNGWLSLSMEQLYKDAQKGNLSQTLEIEGVRYRLLGVQKVDVQRDGTDGNEVNLAEVINSPLIPNDAKHIFIQIGCSDAQPGILNRDNTKLPRNVAYWEADGVANQQTHHADVVE